jgi:hypothetical protein
MTKILMLAEQREQLRTVIAPREERLLLDAFVQPYPRVSTPEQIKNMSAEMQQDRRFALRCGWPDDLIIMDTRDLGVSGRLRMEDRQAFADMIARIGDPDPRKRVRTIIAANESRLFRDRWGKEYSRFMEICYTYGVKVVIANKTRTGIEHIYDFSKSSDVELFRRKCEEAWSYIEHQIGMMNSLRDEVGYAGRWAGWTVPTGFSVDLREMVNGEDNPNYKKYVPFAPWAANVAWLQVRYRELCGNVNELYRELERIGFLFPPLDERFPKELRNKIAISEVYENPGVPKDQRVIKGYRIASLHGLKCILSNPANIGHFVYKGVIRYNNHSAIVDYMDFIYAFNRLSPTNLDGTANADYQERTNRYVKRQRSEKPAFLRNHIRPADETTYSYYIDEVEIKEYGLVPFYTFFLRASGPRRNVYKISALDVDRLFLARFVERLQTPVAENEFQDFLAHEQAEQKAYLRRVAEMQVHIEATKSLMAKLKRRLTILTGEDEDGKQKAKPKDQNDESDDAEADLVREINKAYREHKLELARFETEYERLVTTGSQAEKRRTFKKLMRDAGEAWEEVVMQEDILELVDSFVTKVSLEWVSPQFFTLTISWKDNEWETDRGVCFKGGFPAPMWSEAEKVIMREHYATASDKELMHLLPLRNISGMRRQAGRMGIRRIWKNKEVKIWDFCLRDVEQMELYHLDTKSLHWSEGAKLVTPWQTVEKGNLPISNGSDVPGRILPSCSTS